MSKPTFWYLFWLFLQYLVFSRRISTISSMSRMLHIFLLYVLLYHVLVTFFSFWQDIVSSYVLLLIRDVAWVLLVAVAVLQWIFQKEVRHSIKKFFSRRGDLVVLSLALVILSIVVSIFLGVSVKQIFVWIKYTLYYIFPFFSAIYLWFYWKGRLQKKGLDWEEKLKKFIYVSWISLIVVLLVWWCWQIAKNIWPDFFFQFWYGPLWDYIYWKEPPLYYLTWPNWFQRLSGLFSWPNNYWYFLVAFFWLYRYWIRKFVAKKSLKTLLWILYILTLLATFSRGAILWVLVQVVLIAFVIYRTQRKLIVRAMVAWVLAVWLLTAFKWSSTIAHIDAKLTSLEHISHKPFGFGLWSNGPSSILQWWWYLPENFFVQVMMDIWVLWFIVWGILWIATLLKTRLVYFGIQKNRTLLFFCTVGFVGLMIEGLFLHVLEDSMVNYLYFVIWGVILWFVDSKNDIKKCAIPQPIVEDATSQ